MVQQLVVALLLALGVVACSSSSVVEEIQARRDKARATREEFHVPSPGGGTEAFSADAHYVRGCGPNDPPTTFRRPRDDGLQSTSKGTGPGPIRFSAPGGPCKGRGVILRRDMGSLGVSSFQQVYGALAADALGPGFKYYDEWQMAAGLLRPGVQHAYKDNQLACTPSKQCTPKEVKEMGKDKTRHTAMKPHIQNELKEEPWNMVSSSLLLRLLHCFYALH